MKKKLTSKERQKPEAGGVQAEVESTKQLAETVAQMQVEVRSLEKELKAIKNRSAFQIGLALAVPGVLSLAFSILKQSSPLALIGLGLTFWGALFFLVRPIAYVRGSLLNTASEPLYSTIDRIITDLNLRGNGLYVSPYPREVYLPEHLRGLKETVVFISADTGTALPSIEEMATGKFVTRNPKGIILIPPGSGLMGQFEKSMGTDFTQRGVEDMCATLPQQILQNFQLAKDVEMRTENGQVNLKTTESVYGNLYQDKRLKSVRLLGCPLASAVACAIAKASGKSVTIQSINTSPETETIQIQYSIVEATR